MSKLEVILVPAMLLCDDTKALIVRDMNDTLYTNMEDAELARECVEACGGVFSPDDMGEQ